MRCFYVMIYANIWQSLLFREGEFGSQVLQFAGRANTKIEVVHRVLLFGARTALAGSAVWDTVQGSARPSRQYMSNKNALATRLGG